MQTKKEMKQNEENRKLAAFCRYLRKNPDLFSEHNLHQLMLDDQNKKGKPLEPEKEVPKEIEKLEEPIEVIIDKPKEDGAKLEEKPMESDLPKPEILIPEIKEEKKENKKKEPKEKKPRKPKKKKDEKESAPPPPEPELKDLPENPPLLERQSGVKDVLELVEPEKKQLEPGPVDEMKSSGN